MSDNPNPEEETKGQTLADELNNLGDNLTDLLRTAWDNPERKRVQGEIEGGFNEFANLVKREAESFSESETGQRFRSDINEFGDRIRSAEAREKVRLEVLSIMQNANAELRKVIDKWSPAEPTEDPNTDKDQSQEASEDREATGTDG